ncbi:MAG: iron-sulfur cluster repair di-iron protein [Raineya sp.]|jgi:regulator of cell morphogenesis and NO signaling|nr:iron-sulfur cluster repair di-iron protein [Raineya sp.]
MNLEECKVGEVVAENFHTAQVFTKYGIDFCCKGGISLLETCKNQNIDMSMLIDELKQVEKSTDIPDYQSFDANTLIEHIIAVYHHYIEETAPTINLYLNKLCQVHGERHPELYTIQALFKQASDTLLVHMQKEEKILFPLIEEIEKRKLLQESLIGLMPVEMPMQVMESEHEEEGIRFASIAKLSYQYQVPTDGCQTYQVAYAMLAEFEKKLHTHIHLENNILFPLAKKMQSSF